MKVWQEFVDKVGTARSRMLFQDGEECFYRGVADSAWDLAPSLFRMKQFLAQNKDPLMLEYDLFFEFRSRAKELHHEALNSWDWLFYMRHYGLPTRLLDWTEALGVAVFFAIQNYHDPSEATPCVWLLNPYALNELAWDGCRELIAPENLGCAGAGKPCRTYESILLEDPPHFDWDLPVAIYPMQRALRMHAQRGWFTIHGDVRRPLNQILATQPDQHILCRVDLPRSAVGEAREFLDTAGINAYSIFPDLDGLSRHLHDKYSITYG